jgi:hypothetical protein
MYFVKSRASFRDADGLAVKGRLALKEMQFHRVSVDNFVVPYIDIA